MLLAPLMRAGYLHDNRKAQKAAYRRAADLLQACGAARRRQEGPAAADGAYEGALGLTRKLHYTGYVQVCVCWWSGGWRQRWAAVEYDSVGEGKRQTCVCFWGRGSVHARH